MDKELINSHTKIKICGMTCEADIKAVNTYLPDYIGFVLFFPKSNRNISIEQAEHLLEKVDKKIQYALKQETQIISRCLADNRADKAN